MAQTVKAVNGEMLQVTKCRNCKQNTAWRQSRRTGRWYLVKIANYETRSDHSRTVKRAYPWSIHECDLEGSDSEQLGSPYSKAFLETRAKAKTKAIDATTRLIEKLKELDPNDPTIAAETDYLAKILNGRISF